jgi:hypothetical protein
MSRRSKKEVVCGNKNALLLHEAHACLDLGRSKRAISPRHYIQDPAPSQTQKRQGLPIEVCHV